MNEAPTEQDREKAREVVRGFTYSIAGLDALERRIAEALAEARREQREEDAGKCDAIIAENESRRSGEPAKERRNKIGKVVYGATLCAAAIRSKEQPE